MLEPESEFGGNVFSSQYHDSDCTHNVIIDPSRASYSHVNVSDHRISYFVISSCSHEFKFFVFSIRPCFLRRTGLKSFEVGVLGELPVIDLQNL